MYKYVLKVHRLTKIKYLLFIPSTTYSEETRPIRHLFKIYYLTPVYRCCPKRFNLITKHLVKIVYVAWNSINIRWDSITMFKLVTMNESSFSNIWWNIIINLKRRTEISSEWYKLNYKNNYNWKEHVEDFSALWPGTRLV